MISLEEIQSRIEDEEVPIPRARVSEKLTKQREYELRAKTFLQSKIAQIEPRLKWSGTDKQIFEWKDALYALAQKVPEPKMDILFQWASNKEVHVLSLIKLLNKEIKKLKGKEL